MLTTAKLSALLRQIGASASARSVYEGLLPYASSVITSTPSSARNINTHSAACGCASCHPAPSTSSCGRFCVCSSCSRAAAGHLPSFAAHRTFASDATKGSKTEDGQAADNKPAEAEGKASAEGSGNQQGNESSSDSEASVEELMSQLKEQEVAAGKLTEQVTQLTDSLKRALAEMENVRARAAREVDGAKKFAVQGFAKSMLDVADNLERAAAAVPKDALNPKEGADPKEEADKLRGLLKGLLDGVGATERVLLHVFKMNGLEQYNPEGEKFDPNLHNALFEVPDPSKEPGTVGVVTKRGYRMHERVVRPAEVGVVRAP